MGAAGHEGGAGLVDTHCHLVLVREERRLDEVLAAAAAAGVDQVVTVGLDVDDSDRNRTIAESRAGVFFTAGWHPHRPRPPDPPQLRALGELLDHPRCVAVGEVGLDRHWRPGYHEVPIEVQRRSLVLMLELAADHGKPVVVHDREAHDEILETLDRQPGLTGLMHCFSADLAHARACVARGFACSFAGTVTFPRADGIRAAAAALGADQYTVETDAPFLAPVPHRGRPNEPAFVAATANAVAALRGITAAEAAAQSSRTARRVLRLPSPGGDSLGG